jgi:hypothetical protein
MLFSRLLYRLGILKNLTIVRDRNGRAMVTLHRTDDASSDIRPDVRFAKLDDKTYIANGVDPLVVHDFTGQPRSVYMPMPKVEDGTLFPLIRKLSGKDKLK